MTMMSSVPPRILCTTWLIGDDPQFLPTPATEDAAGADVRLCLVDDEMLTRVVQQWDGRDWIAQESGIHPETGAVVITLNAHTLYRLPLGFRIAMPSTVFALLSPRSSLVTRGLLHGPTSQTYNRSDRATIGVRVPHGAGIIDPDYTEEWQLQVMTGSAQVRLTHGDKVGQVTLLPRLIGQYVQGAPGADDRRRRGGFGSTGVR